MPGQERKFTSAVPPRLTENRPLMILITQHHCGLPTMEEYPCPFGSPSEAHSLTRSAPAYTNRRFSVPEAELLLTLLHRFHTSLLYPYLPEKSRDLYFFVTSGKSGTFILFILLPVTSAAAVAASAVTASAVTSAASVTAASAAAGFDFDLACMSSQESVLPAIEIGFLP